MLRTPSELPPSDVREEVKRLIALADGNHDVEVARSLHAYVRETVVREEEMWRRRAEAIEIIDRSDASRTTGLVAVRVHGQGRHAVGAAAGQSSTRTP